MNDYIARVSERLAKTYAHEPEYLQCVNSWLEMIAPATEDPRYEKLDLITRMVEPERMFSFLIPWVDDNGVTHTKPRLPGPVLQRHRALQGRTAVPSQRDPLGGEIPGLRADL